jgi:hypothetical protein
LKLQVHRVPRTGPEAVSDLCCGEPSFMKAPGLGHAEGRIWSAAAQTCSWLVFSGCITQALSVANQQWCVVPAWRPAGSSQDAWPRRDPCIFIHPPAFGGRASKMLEALAFLVTWLSTVAPRIAALFSAEVLPPGQCWSWGGMLPYQEAPGPCASWVWSVA